MDKEKVLYYTVDITKHSESGSCFDFYTEKKHPCYTRTSGGELLHRKVSIEKYNKIMKILRGIS